MRGHDIIKPEVSSDLLGSVLNIAGDPLGLPVGLGLGSETEELALGYHFCFPVFMPQACL